MQLDLFDPMPRLGNISTSQRKRSRSQVERVAKAKRKQPSFETLASASPAEQHPRLAPKPALVPEPEAGAANGLHAAIAAQTGPGSETHVPISAPKSNLRPPGLSPEVKINLGLVDVRVIPQVDTIADALAWYDDAVSTHPRRAHVRSAFRAVERVLGVPANEIPASPEKLRPLLEKASPGRAGMKPRTWIQAKSTATSGLRALGVQIAAGRDSTPMSAEWAKLSAELADRKSQIGLSRLLRFLTRTGRKPEDVTPADFEAFRQELLTASVVRDAASAYRQATRMWNKAVATVAGWPQVIMAIDGDPRRYSFEWSRFPPSFVQDVEAFLISRTTTNPLDDDYAPSIRRATATGRSKSIRQIASALVLSGGAELDEVTSLRVLTDFENVRHAISYLKNEKQGGELTESHLNLIWLLRTIARHWLKDEAQAQQIAGLLTNVRKHLDKAGARGLTSKNRDRLRQFDIPANVEALIALPTRVLHSVRAARGPNHRQSVRLMQALQVGLLTFVPMRSKNLAELSSGPTSSMSARERSAWCASTFPPRRPRPRASTTRRFPPTSTRFSTSGSANTASGSVSPTAPICSRIRAAS